MISPKNNFDIYIYISYFYIGFIIICKTTFNQCNMIIDNEIDMIPHYL